MSQQSAPENENKRKRLTQACELCRRKKIKCDGAKPGCGNCLKLNINCTYSTSNKKRGPRQGYIEMLEQRLAKMEKILLSADKQNDSEMDPIAEHQEYDERDSHMSEELYHQDSNSVVESNAISSSTLSPASYSKSSNSNNDTMLSNINTNDTKSTNTVAAGSKRLSEDILEMAESPKSLSSISNSLPSPKSHIFNQRQSVHRETKNDVLPSPAIIDHCIDLFFKYLYSTIPIFDKDILKTQIAQKKRSDFFILCLLAATARFSDSPDVAKNPPWYAGEKYAEKARPSIIKILDEPSISNTQALLLLSMHEYGCGRGPRSWMYTGMAMRMAMELGLHDEVDDSEECSDSDMSKSWSREYRRRLLWSLYCLDKISSAATGKPPCLSSVYCNVFLPSSDDFKMDQYYAENLDGSRYIISNRSGLQDSQLLSAGSLTSDAPINENSNMSRKPPLSAFAYFVRIADLLGKVTTYVNSKKADSSSFVPPCSPDSEFQQLDRAIDIWYDELPIHLKNTPANFEMYRKSAETNESRLFTILHVVHNALIVLLHRPSLVASDTLYCHLIQPSIKQFITNSVEKCMAAVDNVTILLKEIGKRKESIVPFLTYFAYTVATVVVSNSFSPRKEEAQKAKQALGVYFQLLLTARGLWAMADKLYFMIQDLYSIHSNVLKRQQLDNLHVDNASPLSSVRSSQQPTLQPFQQQESFSYPVQPLPLQQQQQPQEANQAPSVDNALADWTLPYYINALSVPTSSNPENGDTSSLFQIPQAFNEPFLYDNTTNNII